MRHNCGTITTSNPFGPMYISGPMYSDVYISVNLDIFIYCNRIVAILSEPLIESVPKHYLSARFCDLVIRHFVSYQIDTPVFLEHIKPVHTTLPNWVIIGPSNGLSSMFSTNILPEPIMTYCQLDLSERTSVKFESKFKHFHRGKCVAIDVYKMHTILSRFQGVNIISKHVKRSRKRGQERCDQVAGI